jgi:hypothetical protein
MLIDRRTRSATAATSESSSSAGGFLMAKQTAVAPRPFFSNRTLLVSGAIALAMVAVIIAARPGPAGSSPPPRAETPAARALTPSEEVFDFGSISMAGGNVVHHYWIRNTGSTPAVIGRMFTSCMCTTATLVKGGRKSAAYGMPGHGFMSPLNETLQPDEAAYVEVVFDPAAHGPAGIGRIARTVTIQTDRGAPLELALVATVRP